MPVAGILRGPVEKHDDHVATVCLERQPDLGSDTSLVETLIIRGGHVGSPAIALKCRRICMTGSPDEMPSCAK